MLHEKAVNDYMSVRKSIYQGLFWKGVFYASVFLLNVCIARFFEASFSGLIFYITNFYSLVLLLLSFSIESGMTFFLSKKEIDASRLSVAALVWTLLACSIAAIVLMFYRFPDKFSLAQNMSQVSLFFIGGMLLITFFSALLAGEKDFRTAYIVQFFGNVLLSVLLVINHLAGNNFINAGSYIYLYFIFFLLEGVVIAVYFLYRHRKFFVVNANLLNDIQKLICYSSVIFISNVAYFLLYRIDYWFVEYYCDRNSLGNYIQISKIAQLLILVPSTISIVVFPYIAAGGKGSFIKELQLLSRTILAVFFVICCLGAIAGYWLFPLLLGPTFNEMHLPFILLIPGILSLASLYPYTAYYAGVDMAKRNLTGTLIALLVLVIADLLFIPKFGIKGAALASSIGYLCFQFYIMSRFKRDFNIKLADSFILKKQDLHKILTLKIGKL